MMLRAIIENAELLNVGRNNILKDFIDKTSEQSGTPINRENMMAVQGFSNCNIYEDVNELGEKQIIEDYIDRNEKFITTFKANGEIEEKLVGEKTITKTSSFGVSGNISTEVIS